MTDKLLSLPLWLFGVVLIVVLPILVVLLQLLIRRSQPALTKGDHNEVAGFIIAVVGVLYAVLLAFVVIVTWENFSAAEGIVNQEASVLRSVDRDTAAFSPQTQDQVHDLVRAYVREVVETEWPAMAAGEPGDPAVGDILGQMSDVIGHVPITTPNEQEFAGAEVERLNQVVSLRSQRLDYVKQGVPAVLWVALIVGSVVTVGFALLFGLRQAALHFLMVGSLAALVGVLLFVAVALDYPFSGSGAVRPHAFERVLSDLDR